VWSVHRFIINNKVNDLVCDDCLSVLYYSNNNEIDLFEHYENLLIFNCIHIMFICIHVNYKINYVLIQHYITYSKCLTSFLAYIY